MIYVHATIQFLILQSNREGITFPNISCVKTNLPTLNPFYILDTPNPSIGAILILKPTSYQRRSIVLIFEDCFQFIFRIKIYNCTIIQNRKNNCLLLDKTIEDYVVENYFSKDIFHFRHDFSIATYCLPPRIN